ncbi:hypothetical protein ACQ4PT_055902 [Festuca glaucescens]
MASSLYAPNLEDYLPSESDSPPQEPPRSLSLRDLLDISPVLSQAAGAIVDVSVANHTSMIDFIILEQMTAFAVIMQKHPGWVWLRDHVQHPDNNPLLIFPEGTCVNNQYTVMFKKGAFELGSAVCPIAIKYNKIFVDAFWNSKKQSFTKHLGHLMTSWAVVCDVWFLEPLYLREGETSIEFTERVRDMIAARAGLKKVPWDGYLKHNRPSPKHTEEKQRMFAESVLRRLEEN